MNIKIGSVHRSSARCHEPAGTVTARRDLRIADVDRRAFTVREYGIRVLTVRIYGDILERQSCFVRSKDC